MSLWRPRRSWNIALRHCLRCATIPALLAGLVAWICASNLTATDEAALRAARGFWLQLPLITTALAVAIAVARHEPSFAAMQPGAEFARRLARGPLGGSGAAIAGALLAQWLLTAPLLCLLGLLLSAPSQAQPVRPLLPPPPAILAPGAPRLPLQLDGSGTVVALQLRPLAALPMQEFAASRVQLWWDGKPHGSGDASFRQSHEFAAIETSIPCPTTAELVLLDGTVPLFFPPGSLQLRYAARHPNWLNALLAAAIGLLPTLLALAAGCLAGATATLPTVLVVVTGVVLLIAFGDLCGVGAAAAAVLRGHWLPDSAVFPPTASSLGLGVLAMIAAMLLRRSCRR